MDGADFRRRIVQTANLLSEELGISRTISSLVSLPVNKDFNDIAFDPEATYADIYLSAAAQSYYNVMLEDFSIFQFSWQNQDAWRLAFLPNPWISGSEEAERKVETWETLETLGSLQDEDVASLISELPYQGAIPAIRFEYAVDQYREIAHPVAHLHIGRHTENRWAMVRALEPLTFAMTILRLYYPKAWNALSSFHGADADRCIDTRFMDELGRMPVVHHFTRNEERSLHFASR